MIGLTPPLFKFTNGEEHYTSINTTHPVDAETARIASEYMEIRRQYIDVQAKAEIQRLKSLGREYCVSECVVNEEEEIDDEDLCDY